MEVMDAIRRRRSVRRFLPRPVPRAMLEQLVDAARLAPSAANRQGLKFVVVSDPSLRQELFACLKWAAYIAPRGTPDEAHRPTAYIAVVVVEALAPAIGPAYDVGAAVENILLAAVGMGLGGCWIKSVDIPRASRLLGIGEGLKLDSVVALGWPAQEVVVEELAPGTQGLEAIRYWLDDAGVHHVPKRALEDVIVWEKFGD